MAETALARLLKGMEDYDRLDFDLSEDLLADVAAACDSVSLTGEKRIVVAKDVSFLCQKGKIAYLKGDDPDAFYDYLSSPNRDTELFLLCFSEDMPRDTKFFLAADKGAAKFHAVDTFTRSQWIEYIQNYLSKRGSDIEAAAAEELYIRTKGDYASFLSEAGKLLSYADGRAITLNDIEVLVAEPPDAEAFHIYEAIVAKDPKRAYSVYMDIVAKEGKNKEISLITHLASQFRFLVSCLGYREKGLTDSQIASNLKCSPYRVKMALGKAKGYDVEKASKALDRLERAVFDTFSGKKEDSDAFFGFLFEAAA